MNSKFMNISIHYFYRCYF